MKLITGNHYQVHMMPVALRRSLGQRSRSPNDSHSHLFRYVTNQPPKANSAVHPSAGSVNEYQLRLGRQRQVWFIPLADERGVWR